MMMILILGKIKLFFEQYLNGKTLEYPLSNNNYPSLLNSNIENSVVFCGVFNLNSKDVHMNDCVIVSDALYDKLIASIDKGNKEGYIKNLYVTNEYIKNHFDEIVDGNSAISIPILEKCSITVNGIIYGKTFLMVITIITCVLSALVSLVYVINTLKSLNHSFAVSQLLGKDNKWRLLLYLYSLLPMLLLSFIIALSTSQVITNSCIKTVYQSTTSSSDFSFIRYLAIPYSLSYLLQFIALIGFTIFAMSISFIRRKKNAFRKIKENE